MWLLAFLLLLYLVMGVGVYKMRNLCRGDSCFLDILFWPITLSAVVVFS